MGCMELLQSCRGVWEDARDLKQVGKGDRVDPYEGILKPTGQGCTSIIPNPSGWTIGPTNTVFLHWTRASVSAHVTFLQSITET